MHIAYIHMYADDGPYADPTSAIWAWNLVGYIACICCLWNSNYVEPHRHSSRVSLPPSPSLSLSLFVRSERWKVRYPLLSKFAVLPSGNTGTTAKPTNREYTHTHQEIERRRGGEEEEDALETLLFCPLSSVPCEGDLLPIWAENRKWFVRIYR